MRKQYVVRVSDEQRSDRSQDAQAIDLNLGTPLSEDDAEFVAAMDQILEAYARPYDEQHPVLCIDERSVQLMRQTRTQAESTVKDADRADHKYERVGTAAVFLFTEPLAVWRAVTARPRRTKADWAEEVAALLEGRYAHCQRVTLVCDSRNTHTKGAFYAVFEPARARALVQRIAFRYTPKHGNWLNIANSELSALTRQCMRGRRIGDLKELRREIGAWARDVNERRRVVNWPIKLKAVYPHDLDVTNH